MCNFRSVLLLCLVVGRVIEVRSRSLKYCEVLCYNYSDDIYTIEAPNGVARPASFASTSVQEQQDGSSMSTRVQESGKINACIITEFISMI